MEESKGSKPKEQEIVVFMIRRDTACSECGAELGKGNFLRMEKQNPLCLECADLDHLVFLPRGDTALTRRSRKYSSLSAVVVRFSHTRGRYERQGLLVEEAALERAEKECWVTRNSGAWRENVPPNFVSRRMNGTWHNLRNR